MRILAILAAFGAVALSGCCGCGSGGMSDAGEKSDLNEKNFRAAIDHYFDKYGDQCLNTYFSAERDIPEMNLRPQPDSLRSPSQDSIVNQIAVLAAAGLVSSADIEVDRGPSKIKAKRYTPTEAAKPFVRDGNNSDGTFDLCWAKKKLDKIVKWEGPGKTGEYQGSITVAYTYRLDNVADWAKRPDIQAAFPRIKQALDGAGTQEQWQQMRLTSLGWE
jgi:hypothetical protein